MSIDDKWLALALLYGPPRYRADMAYLGMITVDAEFLQSMVKVFSTEEIRRIGTKRLAYDYTEWYEHNENLKDHGACDDGLLSRAPTQVCEPGQLPQHGERCVEERRDGTERSASSFPEGTRPY